MQDKHHVIMFIKTLSAKNQKILSFRIHGLAESCQVIIDLLNGLDPPSQRQNLCFPSQEILNALAISFESRFKYVKIICQSTSVAQSCSAAKLNEVHTFANLNSWTKKSYGCLLRKLIFQHLPESENQSHTKIIQRNNVINKATLNIK